MVVASTLTARGWARLCARVSGLPARYRLVPAPLAIPTTYAMGLVELLAGKERQLGCAELRQIRGPRRYDSSSATNGLGLPLTPLETTLRDAVAWYAHHGFITDDARLAIVNAALERAAYDAVQPGRVTPPSAPATA